MNSNKNQPETEHELKESAIDVVIIGKPDSQEMQINDVIQNDLVKNFAKIDKYDLEKIEKIQHVAKATFSTSNEAFKGLLRVFISTHMSVKTFWIICILAATSYTFYLIAQSFITYYEYGVVTQIRQVNI